MKDVTVIGIAGGSASGKTTLAGRLAERLGDRCLLVVHDRYYHSVPEAHRRDPVGYNFDHPRALDTDRLIGDLDELRAGRPARLPRYDYATHTRSDAEDAVDPRPVVVVEGILVFADERLRARFDHRVFVSTPDDVRLARRIRRDIAERGREVFDILAQYEATVRPMHEKYVAPAIEHAHVVLRGTEPVDELLASLLALPGLLS